MSALICQYLVKAITAESSSEEGLSAFSREGDDQEVQCAFARHAVQTQSQLGRLKARLAELGEAEPSTVNLVAEFFSLAPKFSDLRRASDKQIVQNLITAYCVETGECAMYEALATIATASSDHATAALAREIQREEAAAAEAFFHFLPTRSKIAFNVLTAGELDPAVETKAGLS